MRSEQEAVALAWQRWDEQPSNPARVVALQDCLDQWSERSGISSLDLSRGMQAARRAGHDPYSAVEIVEESL